MGGHSKERERKKYVDMVKKQKERMTREENQSTKERVRKRK